MIENVLNIIVELQDVNPKGKEFAILKQEMIGVYSQEDIEEALNFTYIQDVVREIDIDNSIISEFIVLKDNRTQEYASYGVWSRNSQAATLVAYEKPKQVKEVITYKEI